VLAAKTEFERSLATQTASFTQCRLFSDFKPNPGGQQQFFDLVKIDTPTDVEMRWIYLRGGIGSGKSHGGASWFCSRALLYPTARGLITANSFPQLETSTLVALAECCEAYNIPLWPKGEDADETARLIARRRACKIGNASILVLSANRFGGDTKKAKQAGRGLQIRYVWADEWAYADKTAFETINGRLGRGNGDMKGIGVITSSPNKNQPYNWCYDFFDDPDRDAEKKRLHRSFCCDTSENKHLDSDYVNSLEASYTDELAQIELRGGYATLSTGKTYKYFNRKHHVLDGQDAIDFGYDPREDIHISLDFNWNPATAIAAHIKGKEVFCVREFKLEHSDTFELSEAICQWLAGHQGRIHVHGDASGNNKSANSKQTNWQIFWSAMKAHGLKERSRKCYKASNPSILDSVLGINNLFKMGRLFLCMPQCINLGKDLESVQWQDDGGTQIDKKDPDVTHLSDCLRYLVWDEFPYERSRSSKPQSRIAGLG